MRDQSSRLRGGSFTRVLERGIGNEQLLKKTAGLLPDFLKRGGLLDHFWLLTIHQDTTFSLVDSNKIILIC
jgi:hypothetical protein